MLAIRNSTSQVPRKRIPSDYDWEDLKKRRKVRFEGIPDTPLPKAKEAADSNSSSSKTLPSDHALRNIPKKRRVRFEGIPTSPLPNSKEATISGKSLTNDHGLEDIPKKHKVRSEGIPKNPLLKSIVRKRLLSDDCRDDIQKKQKDVLGNPSTKTYSKLRDHSVRNEKDADASMFMSNSKPTTRQPYERNSRFRRYFSKPLVRSILNVDSKGKPKNLKRDVTVTEKPDTLTKWVKGHISWPFPHQHRRFYRGFYESERVQEDGQKQRTNRHKWAKGYREPDQQKTTKSVRFAENVESEKTSTKKKNRKRSRKSDPKNIRRVQVNSKEMVAKKNLELAIVERIIMAAALNVKANSPILDSQCEVIEVESDKMELVNKYLDLIEPGEMYLWRGLSDVVRRDLLAHLY